MNTLKIYNYNEDTNRLVRKDTNKVMGYENIYIHPVYAISQYNRTIESINKLMLEASNMNKSDLHLLCENIYWYMECAYASILEDMLKVNASKMMYRCVQQQAVRLFEDLWEKILSYYNNFHGQQFEPIESISLIEYLEKGVLI